MKVGIVGYGTSIPLLRIKVEEIAKVWGKDAAKISDGLGIKEKAVASLDEDSATLAVESARAALESAKISPQELGAIFVGSESKPYAVKPTASIVGAAIGAGHDYTAADFEFACKGGTAGIQACMGMAGYNIVNYGLSIGSDTAQGRPGDALEFSAGSGAGAFIVGRENIIAEIESTLSYTSDTPDFWRRQHQEFPMHAGRFTGEPSYFRHVESAAKNLMQKLGTTAKDYTHAVFHQPNGKFPVRAGKKLGFTPEQIKTGLLTPIIGNTYSGATMIGLAAILDIAKPGDRILAVSYGSGAGSDAFSINVTDEIEKPGRRQSVPVMKQAANKEYIDYATYAKHRRKLKGL